MRRALLLCLIGAGLVLFATSQTWLTVRTPTPPPLPPRLLQVAGSQLAGGARALGLLGLAGVAALPAARTWGRTLVGALLLVAGLAAAADVIGVLADPAGRAQAVGAGTDLRAWPYLAILGGLLIALAGLLVVVRGRRWSSLGARYEPPAARVEEPVRSEAAVWDALDRGEDPTGGGSGVAV